MQGVAAAEKVWQHQTHDIPQSQIGLHMPMAPFTNMV